MKPYFLGLDGGGTKTSAIVVDRFMTVLGQGRAGPSNFLRVGIKQATRELDHAIHQAVASAHTTTIDIAYAYCGIAGSDHPVHRQRMIEALRIFFPSRNFTVDSDARIALTAGIGFGAGIVVIAGTGSVAFGRNEAGEEARSGGWGPTIGDEGSGYSIGREALVAIVRAFDGRGPQTRMTELLCSEMGICDPKDLSVVVYAPTTHANTIASFSKVVTRAAEEGDAVARSILENEGRELGLTVLAVARRLGMLESAFTVAYVGGTFHAGEHLLEPLRRTLEAAAPRATLQPAIESPVEGAARMAIRGLEQARESRKP